MNLKIKSILIRQKGFTFIEVIIATMMLMLVVGAIAQYFSTSGASHYQIYDLKAVEVLKSEASKLEAFYHRSTSTPDEFDEPLGGALPPDDLFLFKYNSGTGQIDIPDPIHQVYYGDYYDNGEGFTISIGNNSTVDDYQSYYETAFNDKYSSLTDDEKKDIDLRIFTFCTYDPTEDPQSLADTDSSNLSNPDAAELDVSMVVIDDMGSPVNPEDDLLGYIGWWVEDTGDLKEITIALQYWYPGADWKSVDPEVIVLETTVIK